MLSELSKLSRLSKLFMAETKANKPKTKKKDRSRNIEAEPKTVDEAKKQEELQFWKMTDDEILLRSPEPDDSYKTSDSWRVFRIMGEFVDGFDDLATITRGVSIFGSARTHEDNDPITSPHEKLPNYSPKPVLKSSPAAVPALWKPPNRGAYEAGAKFRSAAISNCPSSSSRIRI